jgi:hypothetical protein
MGFVMRTLFFDELLRLSHWNLNVFGVEFEPMARLSVPAISSQNARPPAPKTARDSLSQRTRMALACQLSTHAVLWTGSVFTGDRPR